MIHRASRWHSRRLRCFPCQTNDHASVAFDDFYYRVGSKTVVPVALPIDGSWQRGSLLIPRLPYELSAV